MVSPRSNRPRPGEDGYLGKAVIVTFAAVFLFIYYLMQPSSAPLARVGTDVHGASALLSPSLTTAVSSGKAVSGSRAPGPSDVAPERPTVPSSPGPAPVLAPVRGGAGPSSPQAEASQAASDDQVEVDEEEDLREARKYWGALPQDIRDSLGEHVAARKALKASGRLQTMGEPTLTYDRIDKRYADLMGMTLPSYKVRRNLLVLREQIRASSGKQGDDAVRRSLQAYESRLPSEMELMMMPDPGGWRLTVENEKASVSALIADVSLRQAFMAQPDGFWKRIQKLAENQTKGTRFSPGSSEVPIIQE